ncbi:TPA: hypothetical protein HA351_01260 [Methanosarcinaceae archaeon]|nr:hypothetical protein [Methanosarcinaceae archaeon]
MPGQGFPDFQTGWEIGGSRTFASWEKPGEYLLLPDRLTFVKRELESQDFSLTFVRGCRPGGLPQPYAVLDFMPDLHYKLEETLFRIKAFDPGAILRPAIFSRSFFHLKPLEAHSAQFKGLGGTYPLSWEGDVKPGFSLKLPQDAACVMKHLLEKGYMEAWACAELEVEGISPRFPCKVRFDLSELFTGMTEFFEAGEEISREGILKFFSQAPASLPLEIPGEPEGRGRKPFAEALADRFISRFGMAPSAEAFSRIKGYFEWDLSLPFRAFRRFQVPFDRFLPGENGPFYRELTFPELRTGARQIFISASLPRRRTGTCTLGVTLKIPSSPDHPQLISKSVELSPEEKDSAVVRLSLSPTEKLRYGYSTFAVVRGSCGPKLLRSPEKIHDCEQLNLQADDFPVEFVRIKVSRRLLELASLSGVCRWFDNGSEVSQAFEIEDVPAGESGELAVAVPGQEKAPFIEIRARSRTCEKVLHLSPQRTRDLCLDLPSFPGYGVHRLEIRCDFEAGAELCVLELLPEGKNPGKENITIMHFTPSRPVREWTWNAESPFFGGYIYRIRSLKIRGLNESQEPWSNPLSPFVPLSIRVKSNQKPVARVFRQGQETKNRSPKTLNPYGMSP